MDKFVPGDKVRFKTRALQYAPTNCKATDYAMVYEKLSGASAQGYRIIFDRPIGHGFVAQYPNRCWSVLEEWIQKVKEGL